MSSAAAGSSSNNGGKQSSMGLLLAMQSLNPFGKSKSGTRGSSSTSGTRGSSSAGRSSRRGSGNETVPRSYYDVNGGLNRANSDRNAGGERPKSGAGAAARR